MSRFKDKLASQWKYEGQNLQGSGGRQTFDVVNQNTGEVMEFKDDASAQAWAATNPTEDQIRQPPAGTFWETQRAQDLEKSEKTRLEMEKEYASEPPPLGSPFPLEDELDEKMLDDDPEQVKQMAGFGDTDYDDMAREFISSTSAAETEGWDEMLAQYALNFAGQYELMPAELHRSRGASDLFEKLLPRVKALLSG